jgi:acyl-CoA reductase-like NAD-dependent aldehyde dehydrogenase
MYFQIQVPNAHPAGILEVFSPYDGKQVGSVETVDAAGVEQALQNMTAVFRDRQPRLPAHERIAILERTARLMQERSEQLIALAIAEGGKPFMRLPGHYQTRQGNTAVSLCIDWNDS